MVFWATFFMGFRVSLWFGNKFLGAIEGFCGLMGGVAQGRRALKHGRAGKNLEVFRSAVVGQSEP